MKAQKTTVAPSKKATPAGMGTLFEKSNLTWMLIGLGVMILGCILMAGGHSNDPNVFNKNEVYGFVRITVAPIVILAGLVIEIFAIFRNTPKS
jgi:hypothetical protein